jgi:CheY-like chemotaxis protein
MVYGFVKQSGGHVQIYSDVGRGTSVRLFLPAAHQPTEASSTTPHAPSIVPRGSETILVVEDDARVRRVAVARLRDAGYQIIEASTAAEALARLEDHKVDMVFTDIVMPGGMTGDQLARRVRAERPSVKVLLTSGYAEPMMAGREQAEFGSWMGKPYTAAELATRIRQVLDGVPPQQEA